MTAVRSLLLMLVVVASSAAAQEQYKTGASQDRTTTAKCTPTNTTLKDGTLVSVGPDCNIRAVSKAEILDREKKAADEVEPSSKKASENASPGDLGDFARTFVPTASSGFLVVDFQIRTNTECLITSS